MTKFLLKSSLYVSLLSILVLFPGCGKQSEQPVAKNRQWPDQLHIAAPGLSGLAKYVSWASIMEADTGMTIRVVPESDHAVAMANIKSGDMFLTSGSKSVMRNVLEALEDHATADGGPFQPRIVWVHDLANSGFFVRGDSPIKTIYDIEKGTRLSVWNMRESTLNPYRSLLAWIQVDEDSIKWVDAGSFDGAMRAIAEGRADIAFGFPTAPILTEIASAPHGIRFLDLDAEKDPDGARRWQAVSPLYSFGPIATGVSEARGAWGTVGYIFDITSVNSNSDLVYKVARWLDENYDRYKDSYASNRYMSREHLLKALQTTYLPVHEGLIRYLNELGLWTDAHAKRQEENIALLTEYEEAYKTARELAAEKGIEVNPLNSKWIDLWETFKIDHKIPRIGQHVSLTESKAPVYSEERPDTGTAASAQSDASDGEQTGAVAVSEKGLRFEFTSATDPAVAGQPVVVQGKTAPGAECTIVVTLSGGTVSGFPKEPVAIADEKGDVRWEWTFFRHSPPGRTRLEATSRINGDSVTAVMYVDAKK